jgi:hypothetical protein
MEGDNYDEGSVDEYPDDHHARGAGTSPLLFQQPVDLRLKFEARCPLRGLRSCCCGDCGDDEERPVDMSGDYTFPVSYVDHQARVRPLFIFWFRL